MLNLRESSDKQCYINNLKTFSLNFKNFTEDTKKNF